MIIKEIQGWPQVRSYHLPRVRRILDNGEACALFVWLPSATIKKDELDTGAVKITATLKFQTEKWIFWYIAVKINEIFFK